jgi:hypothetical protein
MSEYRPIFHVQSVPKKMYTRKVNIPYYNVYTSFWDTLYSFEQKKLRATSPLYSEYRMILHQG